jgi:hypothetical protein
MDISLINALSQARLGDNAIKEKRHKYAPKELHPTIFTALNPAPAFHTGFFQARTIQTFG